MRQHFALDALVNYAVEPLPETTTVVNPAWRKLDREIRTLQGQLTPKLARFGTMNLSEPIEPEAVEAFLKKKRALQQEITALQEKLTPLKDQRQTTAHHVPLGQLPKEEQFGRLSSASKDLVDTIKLIAYRAETAMAAVVREALPQGRKGEERRLLQSLYASEADLVPDEVASTLTVRLPYPANAVLGQAIEELCTELTATETVFPTTKLRLVYKLVATQNPRNQES